jgi:GNAT superfamily N-acetyltransferase
VRVAEYDPSRRADLADLMERVWGVRPAEEALAWFYERNPVRPASVLVGEEGGKTVATAAISFLRMAIGGDEVEVGMPVRLATDPEFRGRGLFAELEAANEERARGLGVGHLFVVPTPASASVLLGKLGWRTLPPLRVWAQLRLGRGQAAGAVERFDAAAPAAGGGDRVLRDLDWLNWRFADSPTRYTLLADRDGGYAAAGRRGRVGVVAAVRGPLLRRAGAAAGGPVLVAAPPPWQRRRYLLAGYLPTLRTFTLLGKSLDPAAPLPARPHFELGDLDFL